MALSKSDAVDQSTRLLRGGRSGTLSTALKADGGWPYGSLVTFATDLDGSPLFLFSDLSDHSRNLAVDPRASLLIERASQHLKPQTGPRVTLLGRIEKSADDRHARRFIARHPQAAVYAGFGDFHFYRMDLARAHFVGGFARAVWFRGHELLIDAQTAKELADSETDILNHMNSDHSAAIQLYATILLGRQGQGWRMTAIDATGADLMLEGRIARLPFPQSAGTPELVRRQLVQLARQARDLASSDPASGKR